jgi:hypothetical protein
MTITPAGQPDQPPPSAGEEKHEGWAWTLFTGVAESAVELWRDGELRLTVPLTAGQVELLMGKPVTLVSALRDDGLIAGDGEFPR